MKRSCWLVPLFALCCVAAAKGQVRRPVPIALTHVTVIDTTGGPSKPGMTVVVTGNRITEVGKTGKVKVPNGTQVVDASGKFLIPGLWDMHTHVFFGPNQSFYSLYIANGITGVRDMGGLWKYYDVFREKQRKGEPLNGKWPAPRIFAAGRLIDGNPPVSKAFLSVSNPEQAREAVDLSKRHGVDFIKVYSLLNRGEYFAIASEAKKDGLPYAGHVTFWVSAAEASDAGQKSIEHDNGILLASSTRESEIRAQILKTLATTGYSFAVYVRAEYLPIDSYSKKKADALFARFVRNGTWVCPTLVVQKRSLVEEKSANVVQEGEQYLPQMVNEWMQRTDYFSSHYTPADVAGVKKLYPRLLELTGAMNRAGVQLLAGTDTPNPWVLPGFSLHEELDLLVRAGLTPMQALQAATINPARYFGEQNELGTIEKGKLADLVLLDANPLADIHNTTKIDAVFANGRYLSKKDLQEMLAEVAAANKKQGATQ